MNMENNLNKYKIEENSLELPKVSSDELKVFISYSHHDFDKAENIYNILKEGDIDCFIAPYEIKGGTKWEPNILEKLLNSNFFILMLSDNFSKSTWCNQESSIAYLQYEYNNAQLIPICIDKTKPYGIFYSVQSIDYDKIDSLEKFVELINFKSISFKEAFEKSKTNKINKLINNLRKSKNYNNSNEIFKKLEDIDLSLKQVEEIIEIANCNNQVSHCYETPNFLSKYKYRFDRILESESGKYLKKIWKL